MAVAIDGGRWIAMRRVFERDPAVVAHMARHVDTMKGWVRPVRTQHLFVVDRVLDGLDAGVHRLDVRSRDEYGTEHLGVMLIEVSE